VFRLAKSPLFEEVNNEGEVETADSV
jgi:hypothetical protein